MSLKLHMHEQVISSILLCFCVAFLFIQGQFGSPYEVGSNWGHELWGSSFWQFWFGRPFTAHAISDSHLDFD